MIQNGVLEKGFPNQLISKFIVAGIGHFATISRKPRQVRKEATVVADACAEARLMFATISLGTSSTSRSNARMIVFIISMETPP